MVEIYAININQPIDHKDYDRLFDLISEHRREQIKKIHNKDNQIRSLYGEVLARMAITSRLKIVNNDILISYNEHGKPYLINHKDTFYNISHSGDWVVCAIGSQEVGVDIERIKSNNLKLAKRFFASEEYEELIRQNESDQANYFCQLWTLKECYVKWRGGGLTIPLNSFRFQIQKDEIKIICHEKSELKFKQYDIDSDYMLTVCSKEDFFCEKIIFVDVKDLRIK